MELIFLDFLAFDIIKDAIETELIKQEFSEAKSLGDEDGKAVAFYTDHIAYSLIYNEAKSSFLLRSASVTDGEAGEWKTLSQWLFDKEEGTKADAQTIANDFSEVIVGPKRIAAIQNVKKRKKDEEGNIDPQFLFNRFANIFPEFKEKMNSDKITYGQIRFTVLTKESLRKLCEDAAASHLANPETFKKMTNIINDMYKDGDLQVRSILTHGLLNGMSDEAIAILNPVFSEDLAKVYKCSRKLKDKNIKPEKVKKQKKIVADALNNANRR